MGVGCRVQGLGFPVESFFTVLWSSMKGVLKGPLGYLRRASTIRPGLLWKISYYSCIGYSGDYLFPNYADRNFL